jgi:exodeoxyribonuclease VII small subunit
MQTAKKKTSGKGDAVAGVKALPGTGTSEASDAQMADERPVEELLRELDGIIQKMENDESTLEESFACYEAGMKLIKACTDKIDRVEKQIQVLEAES